MQLEACDQNPATSDGIFVYLGEKIDKVAQGDWVEVVGIAQEYQGLTEIYSSPGSVTILAQNYSLPAISELNPPWNNQQSLAYFEAREAMYVGLADGIVVGPTDKNDQTWLVRTALGVGRVFFADSAGTGVVVCVGDGGRYEIYPGLKTGDRAANLRGVLDVVNQSACMLLFSQPTVIPAVPVEQAPHELGAGIFRLATFNLAELFDTLDDPTTQDTVLSSAEYQRRLQKRALAFHDRLAEPEVMAVQEVENERVLKDLLARPEIKADYEYVWVNGPDRRGIDVALLYRPDRIKVLDYRVYQGCTDLVDGFGPDGNEDVGSPQNAITCDQNGDGVPDGNRLFSRPPLLVHLDVCLPDCASQGTAKGFETFILINHWKSKTEDTETVAYTLPRRLEEAIFVAQLINGIKIAHPGINLVVIGDLNDETSSEPLKVMAEAGLDNLVEKINKQSRYSYIYHGRSQALDHILVLLAPEVGPRNSSLLHFNADFPAINETVNETVYRSSDHDPIIVEFQWLDQFIYLPVMTRATTP